jgi:hypothetical protein
MAASPTSRFNEVEYEHDMDALFNVIAFGLGF